MRDVSNSQDILDSRDVIKQLEKLEDEFATEKENRQEVESAWEAMSEEEQADATEPEAWVDEDFDEWEELKALRALNEEGLNCVDWTYGETLIRDSYFEDYAREFAKDIGAINGDEGWPANCIDWEQASDNLKQDYTSIDFDGVDYWVRS